MEQDHQISFDNNIEEFVINKEIHENEISKKNTSNNEIDWRELMNKKSKESKENKTENKTEKNNESDLSSEFQLYEKIQKNLKEQNRLIERKRINPPNKSPILKERKFVKDKDLTKSLNDIDKKEFCLDFNNPIKNVNLSQLNDVHKIQFKRNFYDNQIQNQNNDNQAIQNKNNKQTSLLRKKGNQTEFKVPEKKLRHISKTLTSKDYLYFQEKPLIKTSKQSLLSNIDNKPDISLFNFPDFYDIDEIVDTQKEKLKPLDYFDSEGMYTAKQDIHNLIKHISSKDIKIISMEKFKINNFWYKHRDFVFFGELVNFEESKLYIKKINIKLKKYLKNFYSELGMLIELKKSGLFFLNSISISCYKQDINNQLILKDKEINENTTVSMESQFQNLDFNDEYLDKLLDYDNLDMDLSIYLIFDSQYLSFDQFVKKDKKQKHKFMVLKHLLKTFLILHSRGIFYLDLKPEMIQLDKSLNIRIFDFYNARKISDFGDNTKIFYSPYFSAPEITICKPKFGWAQDIFSIGCIMILLFINYNKYDESSLKILLKRVFNSTPSSINEDFSLENKLFYTRIPKIPKEIKKDIAQIIQKCFNVDPLLRVDISELITLVNNDLFKVMIEQNKLNDYIIDTKQATLSSLNRYKEKLNTYYLEDRINGNKEMIEKSFKLCNKHNEKRNILCDSCGIFICNKCYEESHSIHITYNAEKYYDISEVIYFDKLKELENKFLNIKFFEILLLQSSFLNDYNTEKNKLLKEYEKIYESLEKLKIRQFELLDKSQAVFLNSKFKMLFYHSDKVKEYYKEFYKSKDLFLSYFKRFQISLQANKTTINFKNYTSFVERFEKFYEYSEILKKYADEMIEKSSELKIQGKYRYANEKYTTLMINSIQDINKRLDKENHSFFDYAGEDTLFIPKEIINIIPLTNKVFSYMKNNFKILQVNFNVHNIKIKMFLPGCSHLHLSDMVYVTGGELNDEGSRFSFFFSITQKIAHEISEMNTLRRYHTMICLNNRFICAIGGWSTSDVEYYDSTLGENWKVFHKMNFERADASVCFVNNKWIYIFGGWNFHTKKCVGTIERYEFFEEENVIKFHGEWENVHVKNEISLLINKYNMGIFLSKETDNTESYILVGGYNDQLEYSRNLICFDIDKKTTEMKFQNNEKLPEGYETSFWYEKTFQILQCEDGSFIAVAFNSSNGILLYDYNMKQFRKYDNNMNYTRLRY